MDKQVSRSYKITTYSFTFRLTKQEKKYGETKEVKILN